MDYEKAYKAVLKTATQWIKDGCTDKERICLESVFPELAESEDERMINELQGFLCSYGSDYFGNGEWQKFDDWLEKQKEQEHSDSAQFEEGFKTGLELGLRRQKEQKPASSGSSEKPNNLLWSEDKFPKDIEKDATQFCFDKGFNITPYQAKEIATHYLMIGHNFGYVEGRKNAHIPAKELGLPSSMDFKQEWSEEDEKIRRNLMSLLANMRGDRITEETYQKYYPWLKDLRPSWKPSEEQIGALNYAYCELFKRDNVRHNILGPLQKLLDDLKKLM